MFRSTLKILIILMLFNCKLFCYDIYWYVGAAFIKPAIAVKKVYEAQSDDKIIIIPGGSGILLQKIYFSKKGDLYMPGAMHFLKVAEKKGIILTYTSFIKQVPVFALSKNIKVKISTLSDLCKRGVRIALGDPKAMAIGKIFNKIKEKLPLNLSKCIEKNSVIKALNISQIQNYLKMNIVDTGLLFQSVAEINHLKYVKIPEKYIVNDKAPLAILKYSDNLKKVKKFYKFIIKNKQIFRKFDFIPVTS